MAKKESRSSPNQSTAKKPLEVSPTTNKPLELVASTSKKKKQPVVTAPPESPSDDDEMETEHEGEEKDETDSSSEEEDDPKPKDSDKNPQQPSASAPIVTATVIQSSDSESGSETETGESDSETEPVSTKPAPPSSAPVASPLRTLRKRTIEVTASPDANATTSKRAKTETETETAKKALIQRVWSEEDEIALLEGMLEFREETGKNPSEDVSGIYKMVKESIHFKGKSFNQFNSKVVKLKSKYLGKKKIAVEPNYTKAHDLKCLDLCKKIWVTDLDAIVKSKKKVKVDDDSVRVDDVKGDSDWFERSYLVGAMKELGVVDDESLKKKWSLVSVETKKKLDEEFKLMQAREFERVMLKAKFLHEVSSAIANA